jgi:hypothetical protein
MGDPPHQKWPAASLRLAQSRILHHGPSHFKPQGQQAVKVPWLAFNLVHKVILDVLPRTNIFIGNQPAGLVWNCDRSGRPLARRGSGSSRQPRYSYCCMFVLHRLPPYLSEAGVRSRERHPTNQGPDHREARFSGRSGETAHARGWLQGASYDWVSGGPLDQGSLTLRLCV